MNKETKKKTLRIFFGVEVCVFLGVYFLSAHGLTYVWQLQADNEQQEETLRQLQQEVDALDQQVVAWNNDPFYKEKLAREQLQMARPEDHIFYIK